MTTFDLFTRTTGYTATASEVYGGFIAADAFNGDGNASYWLSTVATSGSPKWLKIQFASPRVVQAYNLIGHPSSTTYNPKSWVVQGSNDNSTWDDLHTVSGATWASTSEVKTYTFSNSTAYEFYRMWITETNGASDYLGVGEWGIGGTWPDWTASSALGGYPASAAFDGNPSTRWLGTAVATSGSPQWLRVQAMTVVNTYQLRGHPESTVYNPTAWKVQGSNDGDSWDDLDTRSGVTWSGTSEVKEYSFSNSTAYSFYRLHITALVGSAGYTSVGEWAGGYEESLPEFAAPSPRSASFEPVGNAVWLAEFSAPSPRGASFEPIEAEPPPLFSAPSPRRATFAPYGSENVEYPPSVVYFRAPSQRRARIVPTLRPVTPPATINDHPVTVQYHPVPLGPSQQRVTPFVDYQPIEGVAGRYRVFVDGQDVTFLRDVPTIVEDYSSSDPMGDDAARFTCQQIDEWDELGAGDLSMFDMESDPPVDILFEDAEGNLTHLWDGHIASEDDYATSSDKGRTFVCEGTLKAAAHQPWTPPTYMEPTDPGIVVARAMNSVISRRYAAIPEVTTGLPPIVFRGSQNQSHLDYAVEVLSHMWTEDGRQWSFIKVGPRQYHLGLKAPMDDYDAAIVKGAEGIDVRIRRDQSQRVDGYFGQGIAPNGGQWGNYYFPGLDLFVPPPYPNNDLTETLSTGDTDAGTSTGRGVTDATARLVELGYLSSSTSVYTSTVASAVTRMQRDFGLLVDGRIGPQTWTALFVPEVGQELNRIRLPLVSKPWVWPTLHAPNGAVTGPNPAHDPKPIPKLPNVNFGSDITKAEATDLARRMLEANKDAVYTGSIDLLTDLIAPDGVTPISRFLVREGMRIKVLGHPGEPIVRVGDASKDDLSVRLMVDEKARDALTLDAIAERNRDARSAVAPKRPGNPQKISAIMRDHVTQFEDESKAGKIPQYPVNGNVGLWSVFPIFVSQTGFISIFQLSARNVTTTFSVAVFGKPIQPQVLASYVPNPILDGEGWRDHYDTLVLDHGLCAIYGEPGALGGYAPRVQADGGPITGDLFDDSGFPFESQVGGYLWVAVFAGASCNVSGVAFPAVPQ